MFHFTTALLDMYLWSCLYLSCRNGRNGNTPESIKCSYIHSQSECCKCVRFWLIDARSRLHTMYATLWTWLLPGSSLSNKQDVCAHPLPIHEYFQEYWRVAGQIHLTDCFSVWKNDISYLWTIFLFCPVSTASKRQLSRSMPVKCAMELEHVRTTKGENILLINTWCLQDAKGH